MPRRGSSSLVRAQCVAILQVGSEGAGARALHGERPSEVPGPSRKWVASGL